VVDDVMSRIAAIQSRINSLNPSMSRQLTLVRTANGDLQAVSGNVAPQDLTQVVQSKASASATAFDAALATAVGGTSAPAATTGTSGAPATGDGDDIAALASSFAGTPYVAGGRSPAGWDCAGFTQYVMKEFGIKVPDVTWKQIEQGQQVQGGLANAKPGDLIFFKLPNGHHRDPDKSRGVNHVAVYLGNGMIAHAANPRSDTRVEKLSSYYTDNILDIRRYAPTGDGVVRTPAQIAAGSGVATPTIPGAAPTTPSTTTTPATGTTTTTSPAGTTGTTAAGPIGGTGWSWTPGKAMSPRDLNGLLAQAGFSGENLRTAWAIAMRESGGRPDALGKVNPNGTRDHGLFQFNDVHGKTIDLARAKSDPLYAATEAFRMSKGGKDFSAWGLGDSGWAGHLQRTAPATYATLHANWQKWYDKFPTAIATNRA